MLKVFNSISCSSSLPAVFSFVLLHLLHERVHTFDACLFEFHLKLCRLLFCSTPCSRASPVSSLDDICILCNVCFLVSLGTLGISSTPCFVLSPFARMCIKELPVMDHKGTPLNPCVVTQKAGSNTQKEKKESFLENLSQDLLERLMPETAFTLARTSRTLHKTAHDAKVDLVVQARPGVQFPDGQGLIQALNSFPKPWTVTVLRLRACNLRAEGGKEIAKFLRGNTTLRELDISENYVQGAGLSLAKTRRKKTPRYTRSILAKTCWG